MAESISKAVLITGCSTGIGRATAERLASRGWNVYATARNAESIADLASRGCKTLALDVCDEASMRAAVLAVQLAEGAVGVLINNAGYGLEGAFEEVPMTDIRRQFETNVFGLIAMTKLVLPAMRRQRWGRIIGISSMMGRSSNPGIPAYVASKWGVIGLCKSVAFELAAFGVTVNAVAPGNVSTPMIHNDTLYGLMRPDLSTPPARTSNRA